MASLQTGNKAGDENPPGTIVIFTGLIANIPSGWNLCDGTLGTPDFRDRFVRGVPTATNPGTVGGLASVTLSIATMPSHIHSISGNNHRHNYPIAASTTGGALLMVIGGNDATQTALDFNDTSFEKVFNPVQLEGGTGPHNNLPTFFEVLFIQKT